MISEDNALVEFVRDAIQNNFKSAQEGRPIFEDRDFVRIMTPGDTKTVVYRVATDQDKARFPKAWQAYEQGIEAITEGTPLDQWNQISKSQVKELQHVNVRTVEQFVTVSDASIQRMGPGYMQLRQRARQFLEASKGEAAATAQARENEQLREQMALMHDEMKAMRAELDAKKADDAALDPDGNPPSPVGPASTDAEQPTKPKRSAGRAREE